MDGLIGLGLTILVGSPLIYMVIIALIPPRSRPFD